MDFHLLLALVMFCTIMAITPGPNNLLLASCGFNFGLRRAVPLLLGITTGFAVLLLVVASGVGVALQTSPALVVLLKAAGLVYIAWLALVLWRSRPHRGDGPGFAPGFLHGITLQSVNLKAWIMALASLAAFARPGETYWQDVATVMLVFAAVGIPSHLVWIGLGRLIAQRASADAWLVGFNRSMAVLLLAWGALMLTAEV